MAAYNLIKIGRFYYVEGLAEFGEKNTLLIVRYDEDCDTVSRDGKSMLHALYDLYQTSDALKEGDTFLLRGKPRYACEGVHVVKIA